MVSRKCLWLRPSPEGETSLDVDFAKCAGDCELRFKPGTVKLILQPGPERLLVRLEKESWKEKAATACSVTALQEFRDLFSSEVLAPGVEIAIKHIAVLFSDLKGSTALYERSATRRPIRSCGTISTTCSTSSPSSTAPWSRPSAMRSWPCSRTRRPRLEAALEIQEHVAELNARLKPKPAGHDQARRAHGARHRHQRQRRARLFRHDRNVGARVQNESKGGRRRGDGGRARGTAACQCIDQHHPSTTEDFEIHLKGLKESFKLRRLIPTLPQ